MGQKGEKSIVLNPPNKTQTYPRNVLLSVQKALVCQINNVIFDLNHQYGIFEAKTVAEIAARVACVASVSARVRRKKLGQEKKKGMRGRGRGKKVSSSPLPLPLPPFFVLLPL